MSVSPPRIAFVTPWFGENIPGGMENAAYQTVLHLHRAGAPVEVLTTTIRDFYADWGRDGHRPGPDTVQGVPVRRFPVEHRDKAAFDAVNARLMQGQRVTPEQEAIFMREMFRSPELYAFIEQRQAEYIFFFIPYLYASTFYGARVAPARSFIVPCLHDEAYAHMGILRDLIPRVRGLVMYAQAERQLAERLYGAPAEQLRCVFGLGVGSDIQADGERFRHKYGLSDRFVLYVGRKESGKNLPLLLAYWRRYKAQGGEGKLALIGSGHMPIEPDLQPHVVDLGFVPTQDKYDAYAAASVLCQPSQNESFSFVIMESWLAGTPVLVHGACAVTREHVNAANGGLYFHTYEEFAATVTYLLQNEAIGRKMAAQGRRYILQNYTWEIVTGKYLQLIDQTVRELAGGGVLEHAAAG